MRLALLLGGGWKENGARAVVRRIVNGMALVCRHAMPVPVPVPASRLDIRRVLTLALTC